MTALDRRSKRPGLRGVLLFKRYRWVALEPEKL
jgi:hypothetical protein